MKVIFRVLMLALSFLVLSIIFVLGCSQGIPLDVVAPPDIEVKSATINTNNGTIKSTFYTERSGKLNISLNYTSIVKERDNPAILSGEFSVDKTVKLYIEVEAGNEYEISPQIDLNVNFFGQEFKPSTINWGKLVFYFE